MGMNVIVITSYIFSVISFVFFIYLVIKGGKSSGPEKPQPVTLGDAQQQGSISELAELLKAIAQLSDSFSKAGPIVMSLVSAIFFLLIAAIGAGFNNLAAAVGS